MSLKIKIFIWYLLKGVVFTKDNLARRNWNGNKKSACFARKRKRFNIYFQCLFTNHLWRLLFWCFGLRPPRSIRHVFGNWLLGVDSKSRMLIITGVSVDQFYVGLSG